MRSAHCALGWHCRRTELCMQLVIFVRAAARVKDQHWVLRCVAHRASPSTYVCHTRPSIVSSRAEAPDRGVRVARGCIGLGC